MRGLKSIVKHTTAFIFFLVISIGINQQAVQAHGNGEEPLVLINDKPVAQYGIYSTSTDKITIPEDQAPETYLINTAIKFTINEEVLQQTADQLSEAEFIWSFGNGEGDRGKQVIYTYTKPGSYNLQLQVRNIEDQKDLLESVLVNIVPTADYKLPRPIIFVDGTSVSDSILDVVEIHEGQEVELKVSVTGASSKTVSYQWDLGDGTTSDKQSVIKRYQTKPDQEYFFPLVRVTDENGLYADTYVQIHVAPGSSGEELDLASNIAAIFFLIATVIIIGLGVWQSNQKKNRKK